jgi:hypothetical protein
MEENRENPKIAGNKQERNPDGTFPKGVSGNPKGKPKGTESFSTKFYKVIDKLAKQNDLTPDEIEEQLILVGYKKAKDGDYQFYKDLHDRIHGKAPQTINLDADIHTDDGLTKEEKEALLNLLK